MSHTDQPPPADGGTPPSAERETPPEPERSSESWVDRLRAIVGLKPAASFREDLADALAGGDAAAAFSPAERAMLANILRLREVRVDDVMIPRADIDGVEIDTVIGDLLKAFQESGHSRMPVYRETLDDPVGLVHIKDLMGYLTGEAAKEPEPPKRRRRKLVSGLDFAAVDLSKKLSEVGLVRNVLFVPPSMPVATLLASMQASRVQMALVIDEYGGTDGLVSLEDVVEVVVGDIEDEHDGDEGPMVVPEGDGIFLADARADLDEVAAAIGTDLAKGDLGDDVDTIGGLVFALLGRIPVRGELVTMPDDFEIEILDADPRRIKKLRIYRRPAGAPKPEPRRRPKPKDEAEPGAAA
jgi:CBS domain containing-hemolysin-like protein